jgi:hypothetical protein
MCTGFVSYFNQPLYGMNFDFYEVSMRLRIWNEVNTKVFALQSYIADQWLENMVMNDSGLFGNVQSNWSERHKYIQPRPHQLPFKKLFPTMMMRDAATVRDVMDIIGSQTIVYNTLPPDSELNKIHHFVADRRGHAMIIESKDYENDFTPIDGQYMVMANFPNGEWKGKHYSEVKLPHEESREGYDRYRNVSEYIWNHRDGFDVANGFEALKIASGKGEGWETLISAVFDPVHLQVFLVIKRDFSHIWRASLVEGILDTYSGFTAMKQFDLNSTEIVVASLEKVQ